MVFSRVLAANRRRRIPPIKGFFAAIVRSPRCLREHGFRHTNAWLLRGLQIIVRLYLLGTAHGRSAGFSPFRIRSNNRLHSGNRKIGSIGNQATRAKSSAPGCRFRERHSSIQIPDNRSCGSSVAAESSTAASDGRTARQLYGEG